MTMIYQPRRTAEHCAELSDQYSRNAWKHMAHNMGVRVKKIKFFKVIFQRIQFFLNFRKFYLLNF